MTQAREDGVLAGSSEVDQAQLQADLEERIETFLRVELQVPEAELRPGIDLFESSIVDSIGVIDLLAFLEREYSVEIPEDDLLSGDFSRVDGIAGIVRRLLKDALPS